MIGSDSKDANGMREPDPADGEAAQEAAAAQLPPEQMVRKASDLDVRRWNKDITTFPNM